MSVTIESVGAFFGMSRIYSMVLDLFASCNFLSDSNNIISENANVFAS